MITQDTLICITGANGFIGKKLVDNLVARGCKIKILSRKKNENPSGGVEVVIGDLTDANQDLTGFLSGCDILFHCAGEIHNVALMEPLHVQGTQKLLNAVAEEKKMSKKDIRWVQLSSCGAYGPSTDPEEERIITETSASKPDNEYEITKTKSDELVIALCNENDIAFSILRPSNVFGASMTDNSLRKMAGMIKKQRFFFLGKPGAIATYIHVDDVVNALVTLATNSRAKSEIFNLSYDCTMEELAIEMALNLNVSPPSLRLPSKLVRWPLVTLSVIFKKWMHVPTLAALVARTHYPANKIVDKLGFKFLKPMPVAIAEMVNESL